MDIRTSRIKYIDLHHTAGNEKNTAAVRRVHLNLGWGDIGYNAVIEKDGIVGIGRDIKYVGSHDSGLSPDGIYSMNRVAYAISHIGNFMLETMSEIQFWSSVKHCVQKCQEFGITPSRATIKRHKDQYATDCPGNHFPYERYVNEVIILMKGNESVDEGILIFGPDDFVPAQRLAATLNNEVAIFMRNSDGNPPVAVKAAKHLFVVGGSEINHPNQTILAGADWFATVATVGKRIGE